MQTLSPKTKYSEEKKNIPILQDKKKVSKQKVSKNKVN